MQVDSPVSAQIVKRMREAGECLADSPANSRLLRSLQSEFRQLQYTTEDPQGKFCWFFLNVLIDDIFYNLSGDIPYDEQADRARGDLLQAVGRKLIELSAILERWDFHECCQTYVEITQLYLDTISRINRLTHSSPQLQSDYRS